MTLRAHLRCIASASIAASLLCANAVALAQHAGHAMPAAVDQDPQPDGHHNAGSGDATQQPTPQELQPADHAHDSPAHQANPAHRGHSGMAEQPSPPPPPSADELAAAFPDLHGMAMQDHMDDDPVLATLLFDQFEHQQNRDASGLGWELRGWLGDLENRAWLRTEGEARDGRIEGGDVELLWGRATGPWWDRVAGLRHDLGEGPSRDWLAVGVQGLAPYKFEIAATAYLGTGGRMAARAEAEYELLLTNRLILQPKLEANLYSRDDPRRGIGKGLSDLEFGIRLRYELHRQLAPYLGYAWSRKFGNTAELAEAAGGDRSEGIWVAGIHFWF